MNEHARLPASLFDDFVAGRPDEERWELIEGSFVIQAPPSFDHQIIARNVERHLNEALERMGIERVALRGSTIDLTSIISGNKFVPDVAVLDTADIAPDRHTTARCYLAVEIVSPSDRRAIVRRGKPRLEIKRGGYANLPNCEAILIIEKERYAVRVGRRRDGPWSWAELANAEEAIVLPTSGLRSRLGELCTRTSLALGRIKRSPARR